MRSTLLALAVLFLPTTLSGQDSSSDYTEPYQQDALSILETIIGYRSAATHGQVPDLAAYLAGHFREGGFPDEDVHASSL